jgi:cytochrome c biogenesis protein CcdA
LWVLWVVVVFIAYIALTFLVAGAIPQWLSEVFGWVHEIVAWLITIAVVAFGVFGFLVVFPASLIVLAKIKREKKKAAETAKG